MPYQNIRYNGTPEDTEKKYCYILHAEEQFLCLIQPHTTPNYEVDEHHTDHVFELCNFMFGRT